MSLFPPPLPPDPLKRLRSALRLDDGQLLELARTAEHRYRRFPRVKASGKLRWITAPDDALKAAQRQILDVLLVGMPVHAAAHGFVSGRSIISNAAAHVGQTFVIGYDLRDFFGTTAAAAVRPHLDGLDAAERDWVLAVCTREGVLPQGAPTSPHLANLAFREADVELVRWAQESGLKYTRYADDLCFSGSRVPEAMHDHIKRVCGAYGYRLAGEKTRVLRRDRSQRVTGLVVNARVCVPRTERRLLRAILHDARARGLPQALARAGMVDTHVLRGRIGFIAQADAALGTALLTELDGLMAAHSAGVAEAPCQPVPVR